MAKLAFYISYDKYNRNEAPGISAFVQLLRNSGNEVDFLTGEEELLKKVRQEKYDCVALSILSSAEIRELLATAIKVKKEDPFVTTIIGGHGVDEYPDLINALGVDMLIEGEGELVLPEVLRHIKRASQTRKDWLVIPFDSEIDISKEEREFLGEGIDLILQTKAFYKSPISNEQADALKKSRIKRKINGRVVHLPLKNVSFNTGDTTVRLEGGNDLYPTAKEFEKMAVYPWQDIKDRGWTGISLYVQKGCNWGRCSYCGIITPPGRRLPVHRVIELLEEAASHGIKTVTFDDDQFIQNTTWTQELLDKIIKKGINKKIAFGAMIRVDSIKDKDILKKLGKANFGRLQIGVESFVPEKIRYFNKTIKGKEKEYIKKAEDLIYACLEEGIVPGVFIITSRPRKKNAILEISKELLKISRIIKKSAKYEIMPVFSFNDMLMAYPGAPLLKTEGYRKVLAPLRPVKDGSRIKIEKIEIPYAFKPGSMALANFIGTHLKISRQRGVPGEVLNETWEHIEDLTKALEICAGHLDTDIGTALAFIEEIGGQGPDSAKSQGGLNHTFRDLANRLGVEIQGREQFQQLIIQRRVSPGELKDAVNRSQNKELKKIIARLQKELSKEKEAVTKTCAEIMDNLRVVSIPTHKRVQRYLSDTKEELKEISCEKEDRELFLKKTGEIKKRTEKLIDQVYPFLAGRSALESLIEWVDEFFEQPVMS